MGLDQELRIKLGDGEIEDLHYWRKHANLQGYMERVWRENYPDDAAGKDFNCVSMPLTREICLEVIELSRSGEMPYTMGFFFGESEPEDDTDTIQAMKKAIAFIDKGIEVVYWSWW